MSSVKVIVCGKLYDGIHDELKANYKIVVKDQVIEDIGRSAVYPRDAEVIDLPAYTVTPGMIDAHMHMDFFDWKTIREEVFAYSDEMAALAVLRCAQKTLARGFTTVRHLGNITSSGYPVQAVKKAINMGYMSGSRIAATGEPLGTPGSHADFTQSFAGNPRLAEMLQVQKGGIGSGAEYFINAVRNQHKFGVDFIKIMATGGFFTPNDTPVEQQLNDAEMKAIIDTAKELKTTVTAHVYTAALMQKLLSFGITGMEHGSFMDEKTARLFEKSDTYLVPTFSPYDEVVNYNPEKMAQKQPEFIKKLEFYREALTDGRKVIRESNIKLGYGTDLVAVYHNYESWTEYAAWLRSGMDPYRTLQAATKTNAGILQLEDQIGTLEPGKRADISAWDKDVLTDPYALSSCVFVMKDGKKFATEKNTIA